MWSPRNRSSPFRNAPRNVSISTHFLVISNAGPGVKHDIQRALNVRNLHAKTALTQEQVGYIDFAGSYEPEARLRDMDVQGIDQVMIIPTDIDTYPWLLDAVGAKAFCIAYNQWAYEYTRADPDRLFFAGERVRSDEPEVAPHSLPEQSPRDFMFAPAGNLVHMNLTSFRLKIKCTFRTWIAPD